MSLTEGNKLHNKLHDSYSSTSVTKLSKHKWIGWRGMWLVWGREEDAKRIFMGKSKKYGQLEDGVISGIRIKGCFKVGRGWCGIDS